LFNIIDIFDKVFNFNLEFVRDYDIEKQISFNYNLNYSWSQDSYE